MNNKRVKIELSVIAIIVCALYTLFVNSQINYLEKETTPIASDVVYYYSYLPVTFIYNDLSMEFIDENPEFFKYRLWYYSTEEGSRVVKTTMGLSYLYLPFFIVANQFANWSPSFEANGYSNPYQLAIILCSFFYFVLGLIVLRKFLRKYYSDLSVFIALLLIGLGTNLFNYATFEPGMSHVFSFTLFSLSLYFFDIWLKRPTMKTGLTMGLLLGLIALIRPTNVLIALFLFLYKVDSVSALKARINFLRANSKQIILAALTGFLVLVPQFVYWYYVSGSFLYYSYGQHETFFWAQPKIIDGLFSYRAGWLLYTPIMGFTILGLLLKGKQLIKSRWSIVIVLVLQVYIIFSWWSWWYGGSFGMRPMIDMYPILAIPLAGFITWMQSKNLALKSLTFLIMLSFVFLNLFQSYQYRNYILHYEAMSKEAYWHIFLKTEKPEGLHETLDFIDYGKEMRGERD
ncbi:MAG: hypothetical protein RIC95_01650 [Vicingaceae bacterium]